ncbi:hypothetical protein NO004_510004 [Flavobacterium psychrophilum]|nr:hypothetical protein DK095_600074 [Flavobacterium psychrophilum]SNA88397.1 hypothetical protein FI146_850072 [Flavobacterium psychrophilum]SNB22851.1 hypothetical protein JIP1600_640004 [Flavobacterium psychrophilum]SNB29044.1 hypothetical protein NO004_510004 [Flavobacterium psychrophilum]
MNFFFLKPELTFTFFYLFFYFPFKRDVSTEDRLIFFDEIDTVLRKGYIFLKQKKEIKFYTNYFFVLKIYTLSYWFDFVGVLNCFLGIMNFRSDVVKQFITLTKTMKIKS